MKNLLCTEWYKLIHDKLFWIMAAVVILVNMLVFSGSAFFQLSGYEALKQVISKEILTVLITCIYGGVFIGGDFAQGTFYRSILSGKGRAQAVLSKAIVYSFAANILLYIFPVMAAGCCTIKSGWYSSHISMNSLQILLYCLSMILLGCAVSLLSTLAGCCFKDIGRTIGLPIVIYFIMIVILNSSHALLFARVLPVGLMILVTNGTVTPAYGMLTGGIWTMILLIASTLFFRRAELR